MADYARGERLRKLRDSKHLSQESVAFEVGVSTKTLRAWEHGGKIRWDNAKRLAGYYGEDAESLVARETPAPGEDMPDVPTQLDRIEAKLDDLYEIIERLVGRELLEAADAELSKSAKRRSAASARPTRAA